MEWRAHADNPGSGGNQRREVGARRKSSGNGPLSCLRTAAPGDPQHFVTTRNQRPAHRDTHLSGVQQPQLHSR